MLSWTLTVSTDKVVVIGRDPITSSQHVLQNCVSLWHVNHITIMFVVATSAFHVIFVGFRDAVSATFLDLDCLDHAVSG